MRICLLFFAAVANVCAQGESPPALMPLPAQLTGAPGELPINSAFRVALTGYREPRLDRAARRLILRLERQTGFTLNHEPAKSATAATLTLACDHAGDRIQTLGEDESYSLEITPAGASVKAAQPLGILRGVETFLQLVSPGSHGFAVPALTIADRPRFPWRGLSFDVARHFMPVEIVKRTLDGMAAVKLNVFHWHLSDNQGFRVESKVFPRLQNFGSDGQFYTQAQIRDVIGYARDRGIRVVPEFDLPGHATALLVAYPSLAVVPAPQAIDHSFGVLDAVLDPTKPAVYVFLNRFIGEMAALFPDAYFHIGGDEVNGKLWKQSASISAFKRAHHLLATPADPDANQALQTYFTRKLQAIVQAHGKHMEGWDEILSADIPKTILIQSWRGPKSLSDAARLGYRGILSSGYYLDLVLPASAHYLVDPLDDESATLNAEEQSRILGGEAAIWSEMVSPETIDSRVWPRAAVIAERLWSPREARDVADMYRRLEIVSGWLQWLGLTHRSWQDPMLVRLAGNHSVEPLRLLAAYLEPVKNYERERFGPYTTETPLTGLVDAVGPESLEARHLAGLVTAAIQTKSGYSLVRERLTQLKNNNSLLQPTLNGNEMLSGTAELSSAVAELAAIGLDSLDGMESQTKHDASWRAANLEKVKTFSTPYAALEPAFSSVIRDLINANSP